MTEKTSEHPENRKGTSEWRISVIKNLFADQQETDSVVLNSTEGWEVSVTPHGDGHGYYVYLLKNSGGSLFFKRIRIEINKDGEITEVEDQPGKKISASKKKRYSAMLDDELEKPATHLASGIEMETGDAKEATRESSAGIIKKIRKKLKL